MDVDPKRLFLTPNRTQIGPERGQKRGCAAFALSEKRLKVDHDSEERTTPSQLSRPKLALKIRAIMLSRPTGTRRRAPFRVLAAVDHLELCITLVQHSLTEAHL